MKLKKINPGLQQDLEIAGLTEATELQRETFGSIKSGADCVICGPSEEGKTTAIVINVIQKLEKEFMESPRALIFVQDKPKMLEMMDLFEKFGKHTDLRVYGVHDKTNLDEDKNQISLGIDVLIGTPIRLSDMFGGAGFDVNQLKMFIVDDADILLKARHETRIARISDGIAKVQRLFFTDVITERVESVADRLMIEPLFFEMEEGEEEEEHDDEAEGFEHEAE
ncbi:DEAD/DEAH box helicase [Flavobacterium psychrotrophum]|uniref:DEAD/DEAH box helicase n=1 Tax=Flavobacterium psychrotrophum TaxID=2294119 RepID=UPI000E313949|nr:DEAD/DEAH box helicase [Flavobacterium psychrotrophum]